jgi:hypothetical protein
MCLSVDLDNEFQRIAVEIRDVRSDWILPPEFPIAKAAIA